MGRHGRGRHGAGGAGRIGCAAGALADDPELGSSVLGQTTGSDEPATEDGVDLSAGDHADATSDGGPDAAEGAEEPSLRDAPNLQVRPEAGTGG